MKGSIEFLIIIFFISMVLISFIFLLKIINKSISFEIKKPAIKSKSIDPYTYQKIIASTERKESRRNSRRIKSRRRRSASN